MYDIYYLGYNTTLVTDELLRLVTPVIPISEWRRIAYEALNLTVNEVDAIESAQTRADVIFNLLHQAVQRDQMPAKVLKQKIEDARKGGVKIGQKGLENIDAGEGKNNVDLKFVNLTIIVTLSHLVISILNSKFAHFRKIIALVCHTLTT